MAYNIWSEISTWCNKLFKTMKTKIYLEGGGNYLILELAMASSAFHI